MCKLLSICASLKEILIRKCTLAATCYGNIILSIENSNPHLCSCISTTIFRKLVIRCEKKYPDFCKKTVDLTCGCYKGNVVLL